MKFNFSLEETDIDKKIRLFSKAISDSWFIFMERLIIVSLLSYITAVSDKWYMWVLTEISTVMFFLYLIQNITFENFFKTTKNITSQIKRYIVFAVFVGLYYFMFYLINKAIVDIAVHGHVGN